MSGRYERSERPTIKHLWMRATPRALEGLSWWGQQMRARNHLVKFWPPESDPDAGGPPELIGYVSAEDAGGPVVPFPEAVTDALIDNPNTPESEWDDEPTSPGTPTTTNRRKDS